MPTEARDTDVSNVTESFGWALLIASICCVVGLVAAASVGIALDSLVLFAGCLLALLVWLVVVCVRAWRMGARSRFWGLIVGALLGLGLLAIWACYELSHLHIGF